MSGPATSADEVRIRLKHHDWEIEVTCLESKVKEVMENVLSSIDNASHVDFILNSHIAELKNEIDFIKSKINSQYVNQNIKSTDVTHRTVHKTGATCRSLLEELLYEGYFETEKLLGDVHEELSRRGYNYDRTAVSHSLTDMVRESILTRVGSLRNYRYIQKRPASEIASAL
jgi:hypothetical protein